MRRSDTLYWHFLLDWVLSVYNCVVVEPHERRKNIIKHYRVFMHYISNVLKLFHEVQTNI